MNAKWGEQMGVQSGEVVCLFAGSSFDSVLFSGLPDARHTLRWSFARLGHRCWSHQFVALHGSGFSVGHKSGQSLQSLVVNGCWCHGFFPSPACVRKLCLCFPADSGFNQASMLLILSSSDAKFLPHNLDILLAGFHAMFHHIIPWFSLRFPNTWFMKSLGCWPQIKGTFPCTSSPSARASALHNFCLIVLLFLKLPAIESKGQLFWGCLKSWQESFPLTGREALPTPTNPSAMDSELFLLHSEVTCFTIENWDLGQSPHLFWLLFPKRSYFVPWEF